MDIINVRKQGDADITNDIAPVAAGGDDTSPTPQANAKNINMNTTGESAQMSEPMNNETQNNGKMMRVLPWLILIIIAVAAIGGMLYFKNKADKVTADPAAVQQKQNQAETDRVLTSLKNVLLITETEAPTVARVEDPAKLKKSNETFYKDIQKGDYLVIFPKRAIIFRESNGQIINVAPIINTSELKKKQNEQSSQPPANTTQP